MIQCQPKYMKENCNYIFLGHWTISFELFVRSLDVMKWRQNNICRTPSFFFLVGFYIYSTYGVVCIAKSLKFSVICFRKWPQVTGGLLAFISWSFDAHSCWRKSLKARWPWGPEPFDTTYMEHQTQVHANQILIILGCHKEISFYFILG